jgi:hypothetical protein
MNQVEQYQRYAGEALVNARKALDPEVVRAWNEIADDWNVLAADRLAWLKSKGVEGSPKPANWRRETRWRDLR